MGKTRRIYGPVSSKQDIIKINKKIRGQIKRAKSRPKVTELVRRSRYLETLTHSPSWKKIDSALAPTAHREYLKTAKTANKKLPKIGGKPYGPKKKR